MQSLGGVHEVKYLTAFLYGLLSFFTPCILPLIPGYFTFLAGTSLTELMDEDRARARKKLVPATLGFVLGFSLVFVLWGASATFLGSLMDAGRDWVRVAGGLFIMAMGVHVSGMIRIPFLDVEKRLHMAKRPAHLAGTFLVGMAFAAGWSACLGPLVGSILAIAATQNRVMEGITLLSLYSLGLGLPFLVLSFFTHNLLGFLRRAAGLMPLINKLAGGLLIAVGLVLVTNTFQWLQFAATIAWDKIMRN